MRNHKSLKKKSPIFLKLPSNFSKSGIFSKFSGLLRISELYFLFVERLFEHDFSFMAQCAMAGVVHSESEQGNLLENYLDISMKSNRCVLCHVKYDFMNKNLTERH